MISDLTGSGVGQHRISESSELAGEVEAVGTDRRVALKKAAAKKSSPRKQVTKKQVAKSSVKKVAKKAATKTSATNVRGKK